MAKHRAIPVLITNDNSRSALTRVRLGNGLHDENWLQALIHDHPAILPISDIEPGFGDLIALAREVPCGHGYIDNLYLTPSGDIVLVETKLWRNGQMRREVVAQALDYVAALTMMGYEAFETAVARGQQAPERLFAVVRNHPEALEEAEFVDAVSLNLQRGRMLVIVLGDGIRTETEALSNLLQSHAGAHFTFALVELATWQNSAGDILAVPSTLARTVMIERGVVRVENGAATVHPIPVAAQKGPQSISSADFWDMMAKRDPSLPGAIRSFLSALEPLGIYPDLKASLNLKLDLADQDKPINFGYIVKNGTFWPNPASWTLPEAIWRPYFEALARMVGGTVIDEPNNRYVAVNGRSGPKIEQLLPQHQDGWVAAIERVISTITHSETAGFEETAC
ncbi:hypothetical protein FJQ54_04415 [Sandaracinobacter neustonicus]|uniref:Uncharacterized protein n=1 Tax=Sandaracinobacter neustonicus TaxID=1715348 RepID=A0A501XRJ3_9SPHN|nr:hypothetical protein [Sandaracinobacter neustonicus]TPE63095.1 hypothetical protein FJQ54_04415 [Sandaracinobacter neustonicus]